MIKLIVGGKGSGKTKKMIEMINESAATTPGATKRARLRSQGRCSSSSTSCEVMILGFL